jgi:hypothetical protein
MTTPKPIPCFGGPLDGKTAPGYAMYHEVYHDGAPVRYNRVRYARSFRLESGRTRLQTAYIFVTDENLRVDFKLPVHRHDELDWTPTEEEILRQAEAEGEI